MESRKLEICVCDPDSVIAALHGGANRIELCSGLAEGGLTPSIGLIRCASEVIPVNVLIRPRAGDFIYTPDEVSVMEKDVTEAVKSGAKGIVTGALTPDGKVDADVCRRLLRHAEGLDNTFHRAFDLTSDPFEALEVIIELGFKRILTSGQAETALEGSRLIYELHDQAKGRIKIMAGAGVNPSNITEILHLSRADEIHASARSLIQSTMQTKGHAKMGTAEAADGSRMATDKNIVIQLRKALDSYKE